MENKSTTPLWGSRKYEWIVLQMKTIRYKSAVFYKEILYEEVIADECLKCECTCVQTLSILIVILSTLLNPKCWRPAAKHLLFSSAAAALSWVLIQLSHAALSLALFGAVVFGLGLKWSWYFSSMCTQTSWSVVLRGNDELISDQMVQAKGVLLCRLCVCLCLMQYY